MTETDSICTHGEGFFQYQSQMGKLWFQVSVRGCGARELLGGKEAQMKGIPQGRGRKGTGLVCYMFRLPGEERVGGKDRLQD